MNLIKFSQLHFKQMAVVSILLLIFMNWIFLAHHQRSISESTRIFTKDSIESIKQLEQIPVTDYSFFSYHGSDGFHKLNDRLVWHLQNVCYDSKTQQIIYYQDPSEIIPPPIVFNKQGLPVSQFPRLQYSIRFKMSFGVKIVNEKISKDAVYMKSDTVVVLSHFYMDNFGHLIGDIVFPVYHTLKTLGHSSLNTAQIWIRDQKHQARCKSDQVCTRLINEWFKNYGIISYDPRDAEVEINKRQFTCFKNLIVGANNFMFHESEHPNLPNSGWGHSYKEFRDLIRSTIAGLTPTDKATAQQILVVKKVGRRNWINHNEVVDHLRKIFPSVPVIETTMYQLSSREQLLLMNNSTVLISPPGAIAVITAFAPDQFVGIFSDYWIPSRNSSYAFDNHFFQILPWVTTYRYPILSQSEVELVPKNAFERNKDITYRNHASVFINLERMSKLVYSALYRVRQMKGSEFSFDDGVFKRTYKKEI
jgi:hypothetical protein